MMTLDSRVSVEIKKKGRLVFSEKIWRGETFSQFMCVNSKRELVTSSLFSSRESPSFTTIGRPMDMVILLKGRGRQ